jgi:hypothetical protein
MKPHGLCECSNVCKCRETQWLIAWQLRRGMQQNAGPPKQWQPLGQQGFTSFGRGRNADTRLLIRAQAFQTARLFGKRHRRRMTPNVGV